MVTMKDVAIAAGVSQATVSYALRDDDNISQKTKDKVMDAAQHLNYTVNLSARNLKSGRSEAIGVVMQDLNNPYGSQLASAISQYALKKGLQTVIQQTLYKRKNETSILEHVTSAFCDAVIFSPSKLTSSQIKSQLSGKPALLLSPIENNCPYDSLETPAMEATFTATSYLLSRGCSNPVFFGVGYHPFDKVNNSNDSSLLRTAGFQQALHRNGLPVYKNRFIPAQNWDYEASRQTMIDFIDSGAVFDGVICVNDTAALGVLRALKERGRRVPDDVSVIGFDGILESKFVSPTLTTMDFDFDDAAHKVVDTLLLRLSENRSDYKPKRLQSSYRLVVRESTR